MCGWYNNETDKGRWVLHRGEDGTNYRTGPTVDHTYRNKTGKQSKCHNNEYVVCKNKYNFE